MSSAHPAPRRAPQSAAVLAVLRLNGVALDLIALAERAPKPDEPGAHPRDFEALEAARCRVVEAAADLRTEVGALLGADLLGLDEDALRDRIEDLRLECAIARLEPVRCDFDEHGMGPAECLPGYGHRVRRVVALAGDALCLLAMGAFAGVVTLGAAGVGG